MSGRPWIKLATKLHTDPAMMTIPREALGNWCLCLSLAGANDDDGRLGTVAETAWHLRISEAEVSALVDAMGGRLVVVDGVVTVRDWCQWQPPRDVTNAKRQAEHRSRKAVTESNGVTPVTVTALDIEVDIEEEQEREQNTPQPPKGVASAGAAEVAPTFTAAVTDAMGRSLGGVRLRARGGRLLLWVVDMVRMLDEWSGHDAGAAAAIWASFVDSDAWRFKGSKPEGWATAMGDWYTNGRAAARAGVVLNLGLGAQ